MNTLKKEEINILSAQYGESFYILDLVQFEKNFTDLQNAFEKYYENFSIAYSYKTNYMPIICKKVNDLGGYAEVVSDMEMEIARRLGVPYEKIIFNGPYKKKLCLKELLLHGGIVNIDSDTDCQDVINTAFENPTTQINVGLRCNFDINDSVVSRFGLDVNLESFEEMLKKLRETRNIKIKSIHAHFATRQLNLWQNKVSGLLHVINEFFASDLPDIIDFGGGLYGNMHETLKQQFNAYIPTYQDYADVIAKPFAEAFKNSDKKPRLIIEPGSALAGDVLRFYAKVVSIKNIRGKEIATVLGSIYNMNPTLNKKNPPIQIIPMSNKKTFHKDLDFGGFTCIESDYVYRGYTGQLDENDYVEFGNVGSYSIVLKPPFILPNFAILCQQADSTFRVVKRAETFDDLFKTYEF